MIDKLIKAIVLGTVLWIVWFIVKLLVVAAGLPILIALVVGAVLALIFLAWLLKEFGIGF